MLLGGLARCTGGLQNNINAAFETLGVQEPRARLFPEIATV